MRHVVGYESMKSGLLVSLPVHKTINTYDVKPDSNEETLIETKIRNESNETIRIVVYNPEDGSVLSENNYTPGPPSPPKTPSPSSRTGWTKTQKGTSRYYYKDWPIFDTVWATGIGLGCGVLALAGGAFVLMKGRGNPVST